MLVETKYDRNRAVEYAKEWAFGRNPRYLDFENLGGDCTNFASQCIYAGCGVMNYKPLLGWYYNSSSDRTPSWTGVEYLYQFLTGNDGAGPYGIKKEEKSAVPGDIVQLGDGTHFYHSPIIVAVDNGKIFVAAHSFDAYMRPLDSYMFVESRFIHIQGCRKWK